MHWIYLAQYRATWLAVVNMVMSVLISMNVQWQMKILGLELQTMVWGEGLLFLTFTKLRVNARE
jgi:hypothetical protein